MPPSASPWPATIVGGFVFGAVLAGVWAHRHLTEPRIKIATLPPEAKAAMAEMPAVAGGAGRTGPY